MYYIDTKDYNDPALPQPNNKTDENGENILDDSVRHIPIHGQKGDFIQVLDINGRIIIHKHD